MTKKILILAGDTDSNLGDLAIVTANCHAIRQIDPSIEISLVTSSQGRDIQRLNINPIRRGIRGTYALLSAAREADVVICGGGGLFQDDDSLAKMPYWALRLLAVRLLSGRIAGLSIGAGPLKYGISRLFARIALGQLDPVSVRDSRAKSVLAPLTRKRIEVVPDPAFLLDGATETEAQAALKDSGAPLDGTPLIGVAVRRWFHKSSSLIPYKYAAKLGLQKNRGREEMSAFVERAAMTLDDVIRQTNGHVVFMPTYIVEHENDMDVCHMVAEKMKSDSHSFMLLDDPRLYKAVSGQLAVMLCGRMHPAILAAGQGTPIVGLAYNPKFFGMFSLLGQENRCISMEDFIGDETSDDLIEMLIAAIREPSIYQPDTSTIERKTRKFIEKIVASVATAR